MGNANQWKQKVFAVKIMSVRGRALSGNVVKIVMNTFSSVVLH